ncbi:DNA ligase 1 [Battus philenor]|uniref:DNA ligase 1 n=1 Tax=Battus philenor TaxID=42288 RepID=UPI0035D0D926
MNIRKLLAISRVVNCVSHSPLNKYRRIWLINKNQPCYTLNARNMSQKSITSFFKITPKKSSDGAVVSSKEDKLSANNSISEEKSSPVNGKSSSKRIRSESIENVSPKSASRSPSPITSKQRTSKRLRSESVEDVSPKSKSKSTSGSPSPVSSEKKKKVKRQRIESSESEADTNKHSEEESIPVKVEKRLKTYDSPKSKKTKPKAKKIDETNVSSPEDIKNSTDAASPKESKNIKTPKAKKTPKTKSKSQEESKIKIEKESPSPKTKDTSGKESKNTMSAFLKRESATQKDIEVKEGKVKKEKASDEADDKTEDSLVPEADYDPGKSKYHPIKDACWKKEQKVPYLALARTLEIIEATSARLKMVEILSNYFRSVITLTPEDLLPSIYLCLNQLAPAYEGLELGIAETYLMKAVGQCTGRTLAQVKSAAQRCGDLGLAAQQARSTQRTMFTPAPLTVARVFAALREVAAMTGQASVNKKIGKIQSLYVACRHSESKYLIRSLEGKLRVGLAEQSLLQALALAAAATPPAGPRAGCLDVAKQMSPEEFKALVDEHAMLVKTTYCECPNYELLVPVLLKEGVRALPDHCRLTPGIPLKPMLAHPTRGVNEIFTRFEGVQFTCEWKYDGERAQVHVPGAPDSGPSFPDARIFSRNQEDNTSKYPDVLARLSTLLQPTVHSCVLDCEAVAYDPVAKQILPFQVLSTRKRKDAEASQIKVQVCVFVFDLLLLNGRALVREPLAERRALLREHFIETPGEWQFAESRDCSTMEEVQQFMEESVRGSCEGLMVKMLLGENAKYDIARRSHNWLKLKKDYMEGVGDSVDAVVLGAYRGRGRRGGRYGGFLLACYDPASEQYQTLCKLGTGFSDQDLDTLGEQLDAHRIDAPRNYYSYEASLAPDVWFAAACVWEVRCADLSLSPAHRAAHGLVEPDKGISLRFPRFVRVRDDKAPEQATSSEQVAQLYLAQDQVRNQTKAPRADHEDFY